MLKQRQLEAGSGMRWASDIYHHQMHSQENFSSPPRSSSGGPTLFFWHPFSNSLLHSWHQERWHVFPLLYVLEQDRESYWKIMHKYIGSDVTSMVTLPVLIFEPMTMLQRMAEVCNTFTKLLLQWMNGMCEYHIFSDCSCYVGCCYVYKVIFSSQFYSGWLKSWV